MSILKELLKKEEPKLEEEDFILNFKPFDESLNEDVSKLKNDLISLKSEIDELQKQINDIQRNKYSATEERVKSYPEYQEANKKLDDLHQEIDELQKQYGEWQTSVRYVACGPDDCEKEVDSYLKIKDKEKQKELEPKVKELEKECGDLYDLISKLYKKAEEEVKSEQDIEGKKLSLKTKKDLHASTVKQFLEEEKESLNKAIEKLNELGLEDFKLVQSALIKDGYVFVKLEKNESIDIDSFDEWFDDEDHYFEEGHLEDVTDDKAAELMEYLDDSPWEVTEKGWVSIPDTQWECSLDIDPEWDGNKLPELTTYNYYPATWGYYGGSPEEWDIEWDPDFVDVSYIISLRKKID